MSFFLNLKYTKYIACKFYFSFSCFIYFSHLFVINSSMCECRHVNIFSVNATTGKFWRNPLPPVEIRWASLLVWPRWLPLQVNLDGFFPSFSSISRTNCGSSGMQPSLLISVFNRMNEISRRERGEGKENFFFPVSWLLRNPRITVLLTVDLKLSVVCRLLLLFKVILSYPKH